MKITTVLPRSLPRTAAATGAYPRVDDYGAENVTAERWINPQSRRADETATAITETTGLRRLAIAAPPLRSPRSIMPSNLASMPAGKPHQ